MLIKIILLLIKNKLSNKFNKIIIKNLNYKNNGDWGLGIGDWGLGPIPNPQSPIPKHISYFLNIISL